METCSGRVGRPDAVARLVRPYGAVGRLRNLAHAVAVAVGLAGGLAVGTASAQEVTILAFGDSLTQGYGLPEAQGFVPQMQAWLAANGGGDIRLVNGGVSGDTTAGGLARIGWSLTEDVDAVIVALGGNDVLRGLDPGLIRANLDGILAEIDARGLPVLLAGLPAPKNYGAEYEEAFRGLFPELARKHGALHYRSFLAGMGEGRNVVQVMLLMQGDGIHPNARGVEAIVEHMGPSVLELAARARD